MLDQNLRPDTNKDKSSDNLCFISENMSKFFANIDSKEAEDECHETDKHDGKRDIDGKKCK